MLVNNVMSLRHASTPCHVIDRQSPRSKAPFPKFYMPPCLSNLWMRAHSYSVSFARYSVIRATGLQLPHERKWRVMIRPDKGKGRACLAERR